jgi:hypothetical protein
MRAPIIDAVFFMGDSLGQGAIGFQDFLVTFCSFCALSKEEMLQLLFIIVDKDRNGRIDKHELLEYFSYVPDGGTGIKSAPIFPVNNKNALDRFRGGKWTSLAFDGLAQLMELFPYIVYPAYHTQDLYRSRLLGKAFWDRLDAARLSPLRHRTTTVRMPGATRQEVEVKMPGRCSMLELLEYSRRKTAVQHGKRVVKTTKTHMVNQKVSSVTKERDEEISRCPLLTMIRNPHCMYYVPYVPDKRGTHAEGQRPEFELPDWEPDEQDGAVASLSRAATKEALEGLGGPPAPADGVPGLDGDSSEGSSGSDDEDEDEGEEGAAGAEKAPQDAQQRPRRNSVSGGMDVP